MQYYKIIGDSLKDISFFSDKDHVLENCYEGDKIAIIDVSDKEEVRKISGTNMLEADRFYIKEMYEIFDIDTLIYLYYNGVDLRAGNDALLKEARKRDKKDIVHWLQLLYEG